MRRYNYRYIATYKDENGNEDHLILDVSSLVEAEACAKVFGDMKGWTYISTTLDCW